MIQIASLYTLLLLILATVIFIAIMIWRINKKCPRCGKRMEVASIQLVCKKCGFVESTLRQES